STEPDHLAGRSSDHQCPARSSGGRSIATAQECWRHRMQPIEESKLPTLRQNNRDADKNAFLHSLLNYHLPTGDQLPVDGEAGAGDFGPRTLAKVKQFQEVNKIDVGAADFKDGVVGPHTWAKLLQKQQVTLTVTATEPPAPVFPPPPPPPVIPVTSPPRAPL